AQERLRVPGRQQTFTNEALHGRWELEQSEQVRHRRPAAAHSLSHLLLGVPEVLDQLLKRGGLFEGVEILSMKVLHQRLLERANVVRSTNQCRNLVQAGALRHPPASLPGDQLETTFGLANEDRLQDAELSNAVDQAG